MKEAVTRKGTTYYQSFELAQGIVACKRLADPAGWPETVRIVHYGLGWAIQREKSGRYWNNQISDWS